MDILRRKIWASKLQQKIAKMHAFRKLGIGAITSSLVRGTSTATAGGNLTQDATVGSLRMIRTTSISALEAASE